MSRWVLAGVASIVVWVGCRSDKRDEPPPPKQKQAIPELTPPVEPDLYAQARTEMVEQTIVARGITDERVITAMKLTPREQFVPPAIRDQAYDDRPLPIGFDKTISQAYIVALMTEAAHVKPGDRVLEIGTGSGYQAAVLAVMGAKVYTMEIAEDLGARTREVLKAAGFGRVDFKIGDGYFGWPDAAPFDAMLVTCAVPDRIPAPLIAQLKVGGRMVVPIGVDDQQLMVITKTRHGIVRSPLLDVRFGPMIGEVEK